MDYSPSAQSNSPLNRSGAFYLVFIDSLNDRVRLDYGDVEQRNIQFQETKILDFMNMELQTSYQQKSTCNTEKISQYIDIENIIENAFTPNSSQLFSHQYLGITKFQFDNDDSTQNYHQFNFQILNQDLSFQIFIQEKDMKIKWSILKDGEQIKHVFEHEEVFMRKSFFEREFALLNCTN
ncbi:UNKNOWN [Stylonychia lemnae]|uniref:Uncharacterized protein n=1 Tax=Stylonychia lemnae TaxID=5949 RepID=A0A077ZZH7_STYLE|nr:UNKNOWN [Stylonychia lemnae]|eukprot:CDW75321.1 UNKNOWN [Stylonychia lemnae]